MKLFQNLLISFLGIYCFYEAFAFNCITWNVIRDDLYFIYRTGNLSESVSLKDNHGNVNTTCSFEQRAYHCYPISTFGYFTPNMKKKEIVYTIEDFNSKDVDGTWFISQGGETFRTVVSLSNGLIQSTDLHIKGDIDIFKVTVSCFSCRAPYGHNVEFLKNGISEDSLTFNSETGKCTHHTGECHADVCSCNPSGNEFVRSFYLKDVNKTANFSCDMMFVDVIANSRFSKYATLVYDGTDVHSKETITVIENSSGEHTLNNNEKNDNNEANFTGTLVGLVLLSVILFISVVIVLVLFKRSRTKNNDMTIILHRHEETKTLCSNITHTFEDLQDLKDDIASQRNNQGEKYFIEKESTKANEIEQKSEAERYIDHFKSKQRPNSSARPFDVVFIHHDVDVERTWVERVVDMLEGHYDVVCGLIGRDFQMDNSSDFTEKPTPVVVTFSKMTCRRQSTYSYIENIDKLVVVMVEECSPRIFSINMKCVDATLDEKQWLKQLLTALTYQKYVET